MPPAAHGRAPASPSGSSAGTVGLSIGSLLRQAREDAGISRRELSRLSGINRATVRKIETDCRSAYIETLSRLAEVLGYEVDLIAVTPATVTPAMATPAQARTGR
jgi:transcriptional regulator with XRE-family HTH domain